MGITALPNAALVFALSAGGFAFAIGHGAGKAGFDQAPTHGAIGITRRQGAQVMQVIRQDYDGVDPSRMLAHDLAKAGA
jgi:hypothetical protein